MKLLELLEKNKTLFSPGNSLMHEALENLVSIIRESDELKGKKITIVRSPILEDNGYCLTYILSENTTFKEEIILYSVYVAKRRDGSEAFCLRGILN